jgi:hypothetical protein
MAIGLGLIPAKKSWFYCTDTLHWDLSRKEQKELYT